MKFSIAFGAAAVALLSSGAMAEPIDKDDVDVDNNGVAPDDYVMPTTAGNLTVPALSPNMTLQYLNFFVGNWNFTCANASATPVQIGGVGILFNATGLAFSVNQSEYHTYAAKLVDTDIANIPNKYGLQPYGAFYQAETHLGITTIGDEEYFAGTLAGLIPAPADAPRGPDNSTALTWAKFVAVPALNKASITEGYRVVTAGGYPVGDCSDRPATFEIPFASESWMYGP